MEKKKVNKSLVVVLLVLAGLLSYALLTQAGNLEPSAAPAPTMRTLGEIYDAASGGINEREGYCKCLEVPAQTTETILTVPTGKRFVLLKLQAKCSNPYSWTLTVDDNILFDGNIYYRGDKDSLGYWDDFPDRCVVLNEGEVLKAVCTSTSFPLMVVLIGYFYDVQ